MNRRTTLIVVIVFALLAGYAYYTQGQEAASTAPPSFTPPPTQAPIFSIVSDQVASIEVRNLRDNRVTKVSRVSGNWIMDLPSNSPANTIVVNRVVGELAHLTATRVITNVTDLAGFGLVTPTLQARLILSDTTNYALNVGATTPDKSASYANYPGDPRVFLIANAVAQDLNDFINNPPFPPTPTATLPPTPVVTPSAAGTPGADQTGAPPGATPGQTTAPPAVTDTPKP